MTGEGGSVSPRRRALCSERPRLIRIGHRACCGAPLGGAKLHGGRVSGPVGHSGAGYKGGLGKLPPPAAGGCWHPRTKSRGSL